MIIESQLLNSSKTKKYTLEELPEDVRVNLPFVLEKLTKFEQHLGQKLEFTCWYRNAEHNAKVGGAENSDHRLGLAVDIADENSEIAKFCMGHLEVLEELDLYIEHPAFTLGWTHISFYKDGQKRRSQRAFRPSLNASVANFAFQLYQQPEYSKKPYLTEEIADNSTSALPLTREEKIYNPDQSSTFSSFCMSSSIISTLIDKGIDIGASLIPGGSLVQSAVKSIAKSLLGDENADEKRVLEAVKSASPEELDKIRLEIAKVEMEKRKSEETTRQMEVQREIKGMEFIGNFFNTLSSQRVAKNWFISYIIYFHVALGMTLWYCTHAQFLDDELMIFIHRSVLMIMVAAPIMPLALVFKPIYNIIEAMSQSLTAFVKLPHLGIEGVRNIGSAIVKRLN